MLFFLLAFLSQEVSIQSQFNNAVAALNAGDLPKAEAGFKSILQLQPNNLRLINSGGADDRLSSSAFLSPPWST